MTTHDYDFTRIRKLASNNLNKKWYKVFCAGYDASVTQGHRALRTAPEPIVDFLKTVSKTYYAGKSGHFISRFELYALRFPHLDNKCECGSLVKQHGKYCSRKCTNKSKSLVESRRKTLLNKYGADNPSRIDEFKKKRTKSIRDKFGVDNAFQSETLKKKIRKTLKDKYGVTNPSKSKTVKAKKESTTLKNFGVTHWTKDKEHWNKVGSPFTEEMLSKARETCIERYGVPNPVTKTGFKRKKVKDKFGRRHRVQGYEPKAIEYFKNIEGIVRIETKAKNVPRFRYKFGGALHNYYPDMLVQSENKTHIIEVKSTWTLTKSLEQNLRKFAVATKGCSKKGYTFWLFCYIDKDKVLIRVKNPTCLEDLRVAGVPV